MKFTRRLRKYTTRMDEFGNGEAEERGHDVSCPYELWSGGGVDSKKQRRSIRLPGADYTEAGGYFITVCAAERRSIFGRVAEGRVALSPLGEICNQCVLGIPAHFAHVRVVEFVVMPNHLHAVLVLHVGARYIVPGDRGTRTPERFQQPVAGSVPTIVRTLKAAVTRRAGSELKWAGGEIWQRNYYERVLRDGKEYAETSRYVAENPLRWEWDRENLQQKQVDADLAGQEGTMYRARTRDVRRVQARI